MRETVQVLVLVAVTFTGCGQKTAGGSSDADVANPDSSRAADARANFSGDTLVANSDGTPAADASADALGDAVGVNPDGKPVSGSWEQCP
jgi:predicted small lipoprotein YifL